MACSNSACPVHFAPFYIVKMIGDSRYFWTRDTWSPLYWDAQHYVSADVAYRAVAHASLGGLITIERGE